MVFLCKYCNHSFVSQGNLRSHQKTAKYCLALQEETLVPENVCNGCGKKFTRSYDLLRHTKTCSEEIARLLREKDMKNEELEKKVRELELQLAEKSGMLKAKPKVVTNNTQYNNPKLLSIHCDTIVPLTVENVKKEIDAGKYTYDRFIRGEKGLVDFISTLISEDAQRNYVCTDSSRNKFHRLIETREWENDNGATFLGKILDQLKESTTNYYKQVVNMTTLPTEDRELGEILMTRTKPMTMGITCPNSQDRSDLFNRIRTEVKKLATV